MRKCMGSACGKHLVMNCHCYQHGVYNGEFLRADLATAPHPLPCSHHMAYKC